MGEQVPLDRQRLAWGIYCRETAGSMDARDFWEDLPPRVQAIFLAKV